jgi:hypothetical protein
MEKHVLLIAVMFGLGAATAAASPLTRSELGLHLSRSESGAIDTGLFMQQDALIHRTGARRCGRKYFNCVGGRRLRCEVSGTVDATGRCVPYGTRCRWTGATCH